VQAQFGVGYFSQWDPGMRRKQRPKFVARIEPNPTDDPVLPAETLDTDGLAGR